MGEASGTATYIDQVLTVAQAHSYEDVPHAVSELLELATNGLHRRVWATGQSAEEFPVPLR
jgi:hypothetical protein